MYSNTGPSFQQTPVGRDVYPVNQPAKPVNYPPSNINNDREVYTPSSSGKASSNGSNNNNNNQGQRDVYPQQQPNSFGFVSDSLAGSSNANSNTDHHSIPQRPSYTQPTTTSTSSYDFNTRRAATTTTTRRPSQVTTRKSTYFQGDLPFFNRDETSVSASNFFSAIVKVVKVVATPSCLEPLFFVFRRPTRFLISTATRNAATSYRKSTRSLCTARRLIRANSRGMLRCTCRTLEV